jgi:hypothetical protein
MFGFTTVLLLSSSSALGEPGNGEGRDAFRVRGLQFVWSAVRIQRTGGARLGQRDPLFVTGSQHVVR